MRVQTFGKVTLANLVLLSLAACATQEPRVVTVTPVPTGAAVVVPAPSVAGAPATVGIAPPAASGAILGPVTGEPGMCYARDQAGRTIKIECPPGY